jgi:hypothetical protein
MSHARPRPPEDHLRRDARRWRSRSPAPCGQQWRGLILDFHLNPQAVAACRWQPTGSILVRWEPNRGRASTAARSGHQRGARPKRVSVPTGSPARHGTNACKGPAQPSPTIGDALNAGQGYLEVRCLRCDTHQTIALDIIRRLKTTPIHELERYKQAGHLIASDRSGQNSANILTSGGPSTSAISTRSPPTRPASSPSSARSTTTSATCRRCRVYSRISRLPWCATSALTAS